MRLTARTPEENALRRKRKRREEDYKFKSAEENGPEEEQTFRPAGLRYFQIGAGTPQSSCGNARSPANSLRLNILES